MGFSKPSDAPAGGGIAQFEGALCIFTFRGRGTWLTDFGEKPGVEVDIDVVIPAPAGQMSTPTKLGRDAQPLTAKAGDSVESVRIFQGWLKGAFNGQAPGGLVLGRPIVVFEQTKTSGNEKAPVWKLLDATPEEEAAATAYLNQKATAALSKPSASPAPAAAAAPTGPTFS